MSCGNSKHDLNSISGMNAALSENPADTTARFARAKYYQAKGRNDSAFFFQKHEYGGPKGGRPCGIAAI